MVEFIRQSDQWFPKDVQLRNARLRVERATADRASRLIFCTNAAKAIVQERYPTIPCTKLTVISNGYDEDAFEVAARQAIPPKLNNKRVLLHSGTIYPGDDRDPAALFRAIRELREQQYITPATFELRLRDPSNPDYYSTMAAAAGISDLVSIQPAISYYHALAEMMSVDALLLLQGYTSNPAVPAKLYEYLRAGRPILGLVHPEGESAQTLTMLGVDSMCPLTDSDRIKALILRWLQSDKALSQMLPDMSTIARFSRVELTKELAMILEGVVGRPE